MTIKDIKEELKVSNNPVAKSLHNGTAFKVLVVGFKKGMILKQYKEGETAETLGLSGNETFTIFGYANTYCRGTSGFSFITFSNIIINSFNGIL